MKKRPRQPHKFTPASELPTNIKQVSGIDTLRITKYDHFNDIEWQHALELAEHRGLDPLLGQIYFTKRYSTEQKAQEVVGLVGIEGLRIIADRTGTRGGAGECEFIYDPDTKQLECCIFKTRKWVQGQWETIIGRAYREEYLCTAMGDFAINFPKAHLEKCAEAACLRRGWAQETGGLYIEEEWKSVQAKQQQRQEQQAKKKASQFDGVDEIPPDDFPTIDLPN